MRIRKANHNDEKRIRAIVQDSFSIYIARMDRKPFPMLDDYRAHITREALFVLEDDGEIKGCVVLAPTENGSLQLDNIAVDVNCQKRGYGRALVAFAEKEARKRGLDAITLYTNEAMYENLLWYPRLGFIETDRHEDKGYKRVYFRKEVK